ncbi:MAG: hypothetical protein Kow0042_06050 [Calditrichia bacterium]
MSIDTLLHPFFVHFLIALFSVGVLMDIIGLVSKDSRFHFVAWTHLLVAGYLPFWRWVPGS